MADEQIGYIGHHAGVSMEQLSEISNIIGGIVTTILLPLLGVFLFYDQKKRKEEAAARKAEADNITSYAAEWKELYEKKENKVHELDAKIDQLYAEKNESFMLRKTRTGNGSVN